MFCTQCGHKTSEGDRFCAACGHQLSNATAPLPGADIPEIAPEVDWRASTDFKVVFNHPEVKVRIHRVTGATPGGMTADEFLKAAQPIMSLAGAGTVKLTVLKDISLPIYHKLGIKAENQQQKGFRSSFGETLAAALCSLAARGQTLLDIKEAENGCLIEAKLPSTMWNWEGSILLGLEQHPEGIMARGNVSVPGQAFDWGRGKKILTSLFEDMLKYRDMQL